MLTRDALTQGLPCIVVKPDLKKQRFARAADADATPGIKQPRTYTSCREWRRLLVDLKVSVDTDAPARIDARDARRLFCLIKGFQLDQRVTMPERAK